MSVPSTPHQIVLSDHLNANEAPGLHSDIVACQGGDLELNASNVRFISGLCLQVILSAQKAWQASDQTLQIVSPSDFTTQTLDALQLSHLYTQEA